MLEDFCSVPVPSKGCFLVGFKYLKASKKHPFEGLGLGSFCGFAVARPAELAELLGQETGAVQRKKREVLMFSWFCLRRFVLFWPLLKGVCLLSFLSKS